MYHPSVTFTRPVSNKRQTELVRTAKQLETRNKRSMVRAESSKCSPAIGRFPTKTPIFPLCFLQSFLHRRSFAYAMTVTRGLSSRAKRVILRARQCRNPRGRRAPRGVVVVVLDFFAFLVSFLLLLLRFDKGIFLWKSFRGWSRFSSRRVKSLSSLFLVSLFVLPRGGAVIAIHAFFLSFSLSVSLLLSMCIKCGSRFLKIIPYKKCLRI